MSHKNPVSHNPPMLNRIPMPHRIILILCSTSLLLLLAACGGGDTVDEGPAQGVNGDASRGQTLFNQSSIGSASASGCMTCHSLEEGVTLVGPSLAGVAGRATERVPELSAEEYLRQSIVEPNAYIVEGFSEGLMYQNYGRELTDQQIADLVAFLLTLE